MNTLRHNVSPWRILGVPTLAAALMIAGCSGEDRPKVAGEKVSLDWIETDAVSGTEICDTGVEIPGDPNVDEDSDIDEWPKAALLVTEAAAAEDYDVLGIAFGTRNDVISNIGYLGIGDSLSRNPLEDSELAARVRVGPDDACFAIIGRTGEQVDVLPTGASIVEVGDPAFEDVPLY